MEFDENKFKPQSTRNALFQQVQEQSDICDVTVQVGDWKKNFHWCVLVISPFFENLRRSNLNERKTGLVKLNVSSTLATETALHFLYGKNPKITEENVSAILDIADFFIIPTLKSACVKYIKTLSVTDDNCMTFLILSSLYDFELPKCYDYIRGHLTDVLRGKEALWLTKDSVLQLLTDPLLMYVKAEDKFEFMVRWAGACNQNESEFPEIFELVDLEGINLEFVDPVLLDNTIVAKNHCVEKLQAVSQLGHHRVLLFSETVGDNRHVCFDLENKRWYGLELELPDRQEEDEFRKFRYYDNEPIHAVKSSDSHVVYKMKSNYDSTQICEQDMCSKEAKVFTIIGDNSPYIRLFSICDGSYIIIENTSHQVPTQTDQGTSLIERRLLELAVLGEPLDLYSQIAIGHMVNRRCNTTVKAATIFCGDLQYPNTFIQPIVTILNARIETCCLSSNKTVALLSENNATLYIYNYAAYYLHKIDIAQKEDTSSRYSQTMQIQSLDDGFVLYNNQQIVVISRLSGPSLTQNYHVQKIQLEYDRSWLIVKYHFCDHTWYRCFKESYKSEISFATMSHETLLVEHGGDRKLVWQELPVQEEVHKVIRESHKTFIVQLPKSMLTCHVKCPHCEQMKVKTHTSHTQYHAKDNDYIYSDSDDDSDAGYVYGLDYYDEDDYYYYSSD